MRCAKSAKVMRSDPGNRVSHERAVRQRGTCKKHIGHSVNASISYNICIRPRAVILSGIPSKHAYSGQNESVQSRESRRSRDSHSGTK